MTLAVERMIHLPTLYLTEEYALVRCDSEDCLLVQIPEKKGEGGSIISPAYKKRIPLHKVNDVVVMGEITMTASAIYLLMEKNIEIHFLNYYGQFKGCLSPPLAKNSLLRMAQHRAHNDLAKRCELARRFVIGKLSNQRTMLQRYNRRQSDAEMSQAIDQLAELIRDLAALTLNESQSVRPLATGDNRIEGTALETILGKEGAGSAAYFHCFGKLIA